MVQIALMKWVFLSPHLDDVTFSCGGLVWEQSQAGNQVEIWTICAGDPPDGDLSPFAQTLHASWPLEEDVVQQRREEDVEACKVLGARQRHFKIPDCIYRRSPQEQDWLYPYEEAIFSGLHQAEKPLIAALHRHLQDALSGDEMVVCPLGIGNHVDHELTRKAAQRLNLERLFYADYPYVREPLNQGILDVMEEAADWEGVSFDLSPRALQAWKEASICYQSQIELFWIDEQELFQELERYAASMSGIKLWKAV